MMDHENVTAFSMKQQKRKGR